MDILSKLLTLIALYWAVIVLFRALLNFVEGFLDISEKIESNQQNSVTELPRAESRPIDKKAA